MSDDKFLSRFVSDFAAAMQRADARRPVAVRLGEKGTFQPGIGPHPEDDVVSMCLPIMAEAHPDLYEGHARCVPYPAGSRAKCDLCFGVTGQWEWALEVKLLRFLGDNGKQNGHMLMHILSPYQQDRSALTDCTKLVRAGLATRNAIVIFGYEHAEWPLDPAIEAFETLAHRRVRLGLRVTAEAGSLIHPVHSHARVFGWELLGGPSA